MGIGIVLIATTSQGTAEDAQNLGLVAWLVSFYPLTKRMKNIGFSPWWAALSLMPIVNVWINLFALFCPSLETKQRKTKNMNDSKGSSTNTSRDSVIRLRVSKNGEEKGSIDEASIKLKLVTGDLSKDDLYWDEAIHDWVPLYCHPSFSSER